MVNYADSSAVSLGEIPPTWGSITGLDPSRPDELKRLTDLGYPDYGFLTFDEAVDAGISEVSLESMRGVCRDLTWENIKIERERRKLLGVKAGAYWVHSDTDAKLQHLGNKDTARDQIAAGGTMSDNLMAPNGQQLVWKCLTPPLQEVIWLPLTVQLAFEIVDAIKLSEYNLHLKAEEHHAALSQAAAPEDYDFNAGWPETFEESYTPAA